LVIRGALAGGWAIFNYWVDQEEIFVRVRFIAKDDGRLEHADVLVVGRPTISGENFRKVPLAQMEAWANGRGREKLLEGIAERGAEIEKTTEQWLTAIGGGKELLEQLGFPIERIRRKSLALRIPDGRKRPDTFYVKVAELYLDLIERSSHRPAAEIAEANNVPVTTVRRWIKEARARRLLGPGRTGKAG
jgi:hypothetical protein